MGADWHVGCLLPAAGELAGLQAEVLAGSQAAQPRTMLAGRSMQQQQSRALLEGNLAAALCLRSPQEYRRWLGAYAQLLAGKRRQPFSKWCLSKSPSAHCVIAWSRPAAYACRSGCMS